MATTQADVLEPKDAAGATKRAATAVPMRGLIAPGAESGHRNVTTVLGNVVCKKVIKWK